MATIVGTVTDRTSGSKLQVVHVAASSGQSVKTGKKEERFVLSDIPPGSITLKASKRGYATGEKTVTLTDGETKTVNFALRPGKSDGLWETVKTVIYAVLIALVIRTVAYEPFNIPSGSMIPTLLVGDYLFVSKMSYGYSKYSLPGSVPLISGRIFESEPERGDVAVFKLPTDPSKDYIKRIIGLPGDRIQMREGRLYINGTMVPRRRIENYVYTPQHSSVPVSVAQYIETLPNGVAHPILEARGDRGQHDNTREFVVPAGHYFAMGDNRDNSLDSRTREVGNIPAENLVGRADILFFSVNGEARLWEVWKWPVAIRFRRLFNTIE